MKTISPESKVESTDFRFALVDSMGIERYPYRIHRKDGRYGFVLGRDRSGSSKVVVSIEDVVRAVVYEGKSVRTCDYPPTAGKGSNSLSLAALQEIKGYRIDPELLHLVVGAAIQPLGAPKGPNEYAVQVLKSRGMKYWLDYLDALPIERYYSALISVERRMTSSQLKMLRGHASAPRGEMSMLSIAKLGGYGEYAAANIQYGKLGSLFAKELCVDARALDNRVMAICKAADERPPSAQFLWRMRPQLIKALEEAGWIEQQNDSARFFIDEDELLADPKYVAADSTTRLALKNARIGQGGFRKRMLRVWSYKCAVTGLGLTQALIASHALAWKDSENHERLDEYNGLLLSGTLDRLFDVGLIAFTDSGRLLIAKDVGSSELRAVGLTQESRLRFVPDRCVPYLRGHRIRFGFE